MVEDVRCQDLIETVKQLKMLPSGAIIALMCKHNIDVILTFDEDFKRVP